MADMMKFCYEERNSIVANSPELRHSVDPASKMGEKRGANVISH